MQLDVEKDYTFRALNDSDELNYKTHGIVAKKQINSNEKIYELFTSVNSHILHGSSNESYFISTTNDLVKAIKFYGISHDGNRFPRRKISIIKNHNFSHINFSDGCSINIDESCKNNEKLNNFSSELKKHKIKCITKLVYDMSSRKKGMDLSKNEFILNKDGNASSNERTAGYGQNSGEILVFKEIPKESIVKTLDPIEFDLYYACREAFNFSKQATNVFNDLLNRHFDINKWLYKFNGVKFNLLVDLYIINMNLSDMVIDLWLKNPRCDVLALYNHFKNLKREIIKELVCYEFGYELNGKINVIEDEFNQSTIGEVSNPVSTIDYYGDPIYIVPLKKGGIIEEPYTKRLTDMAVNYGVEETPGGLEIRSLGPDGTSIICNHDCSTTNNITGEAARVKLLKRNN